MKAVFRVDVLNAEVGVDLNAARAKLRDTEAIVKKLLNIESTRS